MELFTARAARPLSRLLRAPPLAISRSSFVQISTATTTGTANGSGSINASGNGHGVGSIRTAQKHKRPLGVLPFSAVLRSYMIMSMSSTPWVLNSMVYVLQKMLQSKSAVFDVDRNPVLRGILRTTFYSQFCAGENIQEVTKTTRKLQKVGYSGIILDYANEYLEEETTASNVDPAAAETATVKLWRDGLLRSIEMVQPGDFVGMKWSGMGFGALRRLKHGSPPSDAMHEAMTAVCDAASAKGVKLLPAAEPQSAQAAVDRWTCDLALKYNKLKPGHALIYNTYQCYLKTTPATLSKHLADAAEQGYTLGIKLVRGAYLGSERRDLILDTKADTDSAYDATTKELLEARYGDSLRAPTTGIPPFPTINVMLATHNSASVDQARALRDAQTPQQRALVPLAYAQLHGMADEVSCVLLQTGGGTVPTAAGSGAGAAAPELPRTYKCTAWGSMKECLNYLLRRADENREAMGRTRETRRAMGRELRTRVFREPFAFGRS